MKIVYISDAQFPSFSAHAIQTVSMCEALGQLGHQVTLLAQANPAIPKSIPDFFGVKNNFLVSLYAKDTSRLAKALSIARGVRLSSAEVIMTRSIRVAFFARLAGYQTILELHKSPQVDGLFTRALFRKLFLFTKNLAVVAISEALKKDIETEFVETKNRILVAHDGARFDANATRIGKEGQRKKVGILTRPYAGKGFRFSLELASARPELEFLIIGVNPQDFDDGNIPQNVQLQGVVEPARVGSYLAECDILLAPYSAKVSDVSGRDISRWMSPLKLFEYMSLACPIISSDLPVIREVLENRKNALLCEPDNVQTWNAAINELTSNPALCATLSQNAYTKFLSQYTWPKRCQRIMEALEKSI